MFQHADRYDPVELAILVAVVPKGKIQPVFKAVLCRGFRCVGQLVIWTG
ncbi:MAG: Uncharacterised protein [SAR116 cluster bacterium]|nr:MAG: Uncharacterised protein [SAR116 cluster bacterium]